MKSSLRLVVFREFIVMNRFDGNTYRLKYVRLFIACGKLKINAVQQHNLPTQTQNKTQHVGITVILCCGCVTNVEVENK
jgi:hypothetical protein